MSKSSISLKLSSEELVVHLKCYDDLIEELLGLNQYLDPSSHRYRSNVQRIKYAKEAKNRLLITERNDNSIRLKESSENFV